MRRPITAVLGNERVNERGDKYQRYRVLHLFSSPKYVFPVSVLVYVHASQYSKISPAAVDNV